MNLASAAQRTAWYVLTHRQLGTTTRRRKVPRARHPELIESDYARAIIGAILTPVRVELAPLLVALPGLVRSAQVSRGERHDEDETQTARALIARARQTLVGVANQTAIEGLSDRAAKQVAAHHKRELARQTTAALGVEVPLQDRSIPALTKHFVAENVALIKSLAGRPLDEVEKLVTRAFTDGMRAETLAAEIAKRYEVAEHHARLIARDQIGKLNGQIAQARHKELGLSRFRWRSMRDPKVRREHKAREGVVYEYAKPHPVPGQEICCRCYEEPIFDDLLEMVASGGDRPPPPVPPAPPSRGPIGSGSGSSSSSPSSNRGSSSASTLTRTTAIPGSATVSLPSLQPSATTATMPVPTPALRPVMPPSTLTERASLASRTIVATAQLGGGKNETRRATLDNSSEAVWKPASGEARLRSNIQPGTYYLREAAASRVAEHLGVADLVPSTVVKEYRGAIGSLQSMVRGARQYERGRPLPPMFDRDGAERMRVFDFVVGNSDRHMRNVLQISRDGRSIPVLIDNGLAFPSGRMGQFIQPSRLVPNAHGPLLGTTLQQIQEIDLPTLARTLVESNLDELAVKHTLYRADLLKQHPDVLEVRGLGSRAWDDAARALEAGITPSRQRQIDEIYEAARGAR